MNYPKQLLLLATAAWLLSGCDRTPQATGTSDDTHSSINISGRVFTDQSKPLGAVIVHLRHANLTDTTDGDGKFSIKSDLTKIPISARIGVDTLDYLRDGALVHSTPITAWIDTLPDLFLVQRDISGDIDHGNTPIRSVRATIWNNHHDTLSIPLEWNPATNHYSGFAWFRYTGVVDSFQCIVKAFDDSGRIIGASSIQNFTSRAGDILVPSFSGVGLLPSTTAPQSISYSVARRDTIRLRTKASISSGEALSYRWLVGNGTWISGRSDTLIQIPNNAPDTFVVHAFVLRPDGAGTRIEFTLLIKPAPQPFASIWTTTNRSAEGFTAMLGSYSLALSEEAIPLHFVDSAFRAKIVSRYLIVSNERIKLFSGYPGGPRIFDSLARTLPKIPVSGKDTLITIDSGSHELIYMVCDEFGTCSIDWEGLDILPALPKGISAYADRSFIHVDWKNPAGLLPSAWSMLVTDSLGNVINNLSIPPETTSVKILRTNLSSKLSVKLGYTFPISPFSYHGPALDTTIFIEALPVAWNFDSAPAPVTSPWKDSIGYPYQILSSSTLISTKVSRTLDPVLKSYGGRIDYSTPTDIGSPSFSLMLPFANWNGISALSIRLRGTDKLRASFSLLNDQNFNSTPSTEITKSVTSKGATFTIPFDSLANGNNQPYSDWRNAQALQIVFSCPQDGGVCPNFNGFVLIDDIKFNR